MLDNIGLLYLIMHHQHLIFSYISSFSSLLFIFIHIRP